MSHIENEHKDQNSLEKKEENPITKSEIKSKQNKNIDKNEKKRVYKKHKMSTNPSLFSKKTEPEIKMKMESSEKKSNKIQDKNIVKNEIEAPANSESYNFYKENDTL